MLVVIGFVFRSKPKQSNQGERSTWSGDATRNVEFGMSESTVTITVDEEKKKETQILDKHTIVYMFC
jgi:hypothetical protein